MNNRKFNLFIMTLVVGITTLISIPAKANITITPTIVVIEGRQRYADVYVVNTTDKRQTYELSTKFMEMEEDLGTYRKIEKSLTDFDLSQNVIFTPRRVTIAPKSTQKVRVALRLKGSPPPPGDYRFHLSLINRGDKAVSAGEMTTGNERAVTVGMNVGFSIPVVYRVGDVNAGSAKIGNVTTRINPKTKKIEVVIPVVRTPGPYGAMGDLTVSYNGEKVGQVGNANIFPEVSGRTFVIPLNVQSLSGGRLNIVLRDYNKDKKRIFDEKNVDIAGQ